MKVNEFIELVKEKEDYKILVINGNIYPLELYVSNCFFLLDIIWDKKEIFESITAQNIIDEYIKVSDKEISTDYYLVYEEDDCCCYHDYKKIEIDDNKKIIYIS